MAKPLPQDITSYDLLKTLAVVLMIVDHIGYYFFPEQLWWRAAGRLSAPIWLFLIGYARSRDLSPRLWIGAGVLLLAALLVNATFFPVNILVTIIILRLTIDAVAEWALDKPGTLLRAMVYAFILAIPASFLFEYGMSAFALALFGYTARRAAAGETAAYNQVQVMMIFALVIYIIMAFLTFNFSAMQMGFVMGGCAAAFLMLYGFRARTYPRLTGLLPAPLVFLLQLGGRRTLEIYVIHLLAFKAAALYFGFEGYGLFEWTWF